MHHQEALTNMEEVKAWDRQVIRLVNEEDYEARERCDA